MLDTIPSEPSAGLVVVALAVAITVVRLLSRHAIAVAALALGVGVAHALGVRGADAVVDALEAGLSVLVEVLVLLARVVDYALVAGFELLVAGVDDLSSTGAGPGLPSVGLPEVALPTVGYLGLLAAVLTLSLLAGLVLVRFSYETASSPVGAWTGAIGIVLGLAGALWTLLRANAFDLTTLQLLGAAVAAPIGLAVGVLATLVLLKPNYRLAEHAEEIEQRFSPEERTDDATENVEEGS
ncbi:hypothetical protein [Halalkalicoccus ordinarius]|uniref:hypothetical protein n=1 Tax=Halalkalicoccus ordinarius TaxID=3116651 RepID=UPI00300ECB26